MTWNTLANPKHPVWPIAQGLVELGGLLAVLMLLANQPDETELRVWATFLPIWLGTRGASAGLKRMFKGEADK